MDPNLQKRKSVTVNVPVRSTQEESEQLNRRMSIPRKGTGSSLTNKERQSLERNVKRGSREGDYRKFDKQPLLEESERRKNEDFTDIKLRIEEDPDEALHNRWRLSFQRIAKFWQRLFHLPDIHQPICYVKATEQNAKSKKFFEQYEKPITTAISPKQSMYLELDLNFKEDMIGIYDEVVNSRTGGTNKSDLFDTSKFDMKNYEGWSLESFKHLKHTFRVFDKDEDGVVDFYEWADVLDEFGDVTNEDERRFYFGMVDSEGFGTLSFEQFCTLMYNLTMRPVETSNMQHLPSGTSMDLLNTTAKVRFSPHPKSNAHPTGGSKAIPGSSKDVNNMIPVGYSSSKLSSFTSIGSTDHQKDELSLLPLGETLRRIHRHIQRIVSMDVIQQLQAGVF